MPLTKVVLREGDRRTFARPNDDVRVAYTGWLRDPQTGAKGKRFDLKADFAVRIGIGAVIRGWEEVLQRMSLGEKSLVTIPPLIRELAYGQTGFPSLIPPNSTLIYELELKSINEKTAR